MASKRVRGFAPWKPQARTLPLVAAIERVLSTYRDSLPLTGRQVFYRLVATENYSKTEASYKSLLEVINRARRAHIIPMDAIRDDGAVTVGDGRFTDGADFLQTCLQWADRFALDLLQDQPLHVELACEAAGMVPQLARLAAPYGITVRSGGGFDSTTVKHNLGRLYSSMKKPVVLLHVGDLDPSGEHIHLSLAEDLAAFSAHYSGPEIRVRRVAVTPNQRLLYDLPTAPPKKDDKREFEHDFTVQAEALPPDVLAQIVGDEIRWHLDPDILATSQARQAEIRAVLVERLRGVIDA